MATLWDLHRRQIGADLAGTGLTWNAGTDQIDAVGGGSAPDDAQYLALAVDATLSNERVFTVGDGLDGTDGGAGSTYTIAVDVTDILGAGLTETSNNIVLGTPTTLTVSTTNSVSGTTHSHAITATDDPGVASAILKTFTDGSLTLSGNLYLAGGATVGAGAPDANTYIDFPNNEIDLVTDGDIILALSFTSPSTYDATTLANWNFPEYLYHAGDTDTYLRYQADQITLRAGGVDMLDIVEGTTDYVNFPAGLVYLNETANTFQTIGITINGGANDDEYFTIKSSDVSHGMTSITEADTCGVVTKSSGTNGGLGLFGFNDVVVGVNIIGYVNTQTTTKTTTSLPDVLAQGRPKSGTSYGNSTAEANIFGVQTPISGSNRTLFIVDAEGDLHVDGSTSLTAFDSYDDAALVRAFDMVRTPAQVIRSEWDDHVKYNEADLVQAGILGDTVENGGLVNVTQLQRLHNGAIWQLYTQNQALTQQVTALENQLKRLETKWH